MNRIARIAALAGVVCGVSSCSGGHASGGVPSAISVPPATNVSTPTPSPTPALSGSASATETVPAAGGAVPLPSIEGSGGTLTFSSNNAPAGTTVSIVHDVESEPGPLFQSVELTFSNPVTFTTFPPQFSILSEPGYDSRNGLYSAGFVDANAGTSTQGSAILCGADIYVPAGQSPESVAVSDTYTLQLYNYAATPGAVASVTCPPSS